MSTSGNWFVDTLTRIGKEVPKVYVETGLFRGDGIQAAIGHFEEIHGIELDPIFHADCRQRFLDEPNVSIHLGDSAKVIEYLYIDEPALFFLDAHYSGGKTAYGLAEDKGCPVLRELKVIGKRKRNDIIVVDDMRLMGKLEWSGEDGTDWPKTQFDFRHATVENMVKALGWPNTVVNTFVCEDIDRLILMPYNV